jgi:hypothetical protein
MQFRRLIDPAFDGQCDLGQQLPLVSPIAVDAQSRVFRTVIDGQVTTRAAALVFQADLRWRRDYDAGHGPLCALFD